MKYKTRGQSTPRNKQKLYFCCHEEDFETCFERISEIILENHNCVIFYREGSEALTEDEKESLKEMTVVVFPVTEKFLKEPGRAGQEIDLARKAGVPLLPLAVEMFPVDAYTALLGSLQYLDMQENDATSLGFTEKLRRYLNAKLVDGRTGSRIRKSLDALIFLSYRKKDRKYANRIMQKIHRYPRFRDVGIWYDEYLIPGEAFDELIRRQLEESDLFALMVTPNIVNEDNYVRDVEYGQAQGCEKKILPAEFEETHTDRQELDTSFPSFPKVVNASNDVELELALEEVFSDTDLRNKDGDPEHLYLMGLAYMNGVDMEVNRERGRELIRQAAELDHEPAVDRMLYDAEYVLYDFEESRRLCTQLIRIRKKLHEDAKPSGDRTEEKEPSVEEVKNSLPDVLDAMFELVHIYRENRDPEQALKALDEVISYAEEHRPEAKDRETETAVRLRLVKAFITRALLNESGGTGSVLADMDEAEREMTELAGLGFQETFGRGEPTMAEIRSCRADILKRMGRLREAEELYREAIPVFESAYERIGSTGVAQSLIKMQGELGALLMDCGKEEEAEGRLKKAYDTAVKLKEEDKTEETLRTHAVCADRMGEAVGLTDPEEALRYYSEAYGCFKVLAEHTGKAEFRRDLAINQDCMGRLLSLTGRKEEGLERYRAAYEIRKELYERNPFPQAYEDLGISFYNLGMTERSGEEVGKAFEIFSQLAAKYPGNQRYVQLCMACINLRQQIISETETKENKKEEPRKKGFFQWLKGDRK